MKDEDKTRDELIHELADLRLRVRLIEQTLKEKESSYDQKLAGLQRLDLVGELAAAVGHEVRHPLTSVRGFLQVLGGKKECSQYHTYFNLMIEEIDRANAIITEYLSMASQKKPEMKKQSLNYVLRSLSPLVEADAVNQGKEVDIELGYVPDIEMYESEVRQLVFNLVHNGLEASCPGSGLFIRTFQEGQEVVLSVRDRGCGMDRDTLSKLGTPFFTTKKNGTGLGLATCYRIAARHGANIEVESGPEGSTFSVRFKLA